MGLATVTPMADRPEPNLFADAGELLRMMVPGGLGDIRTRAHRRGVKVWFGPEKPTREHYEAQLIPRRFVDDRDGAVLETDPEAPFEIACRLVDYLSVIEPIRLGD